MSESLPDSPADPLPGASALAPPPLPVVRYRLGFRALEPLELPAFAGSMWRGVLGRALTLLDRLAGLEQGYTPRLYRSLFEIAHAGEGGERASPPFVLYAPPPKNEQIAAGSAVRMGITLIGDGAELAMPAIAALMLAGEIGLGATPGRAALERVRATAPQLPAWYDVLDGDERLHPLEPSIPDVSTTPRRVLLWFETPLRLKRNGRLVGPRDLEPGLVIWQAIRRIGILADLYGPGTAGIDFVHLQRLAFSVRALDAELHWQEQERRATRFRESQRFGGIMGHMLLDLDDAAPRLWPWLAFVPWLHVGSTTTMGLGRIALQGLEDNARS